MQVNNQVYIKGGLGNEGRGLKGVIGTQPRLRNVRAWTNLKVYTLLQRGRTFIRSIYKR